MHDVYFCVFYGVKRDPSQNEFGRLMEIMSNVLSSYILLYDLCPYIHKLFFG